jgi:hypothetical protein
VELRLPLFSRSEGCSKNRAGGQTRHQIFGKCSQETKDRIKIWLDESNRCMPDINTAQEDVPYQNQVPSKTVNVIPDTDKKPHTNKEGQDTKKKDAASFEEKGGCKRGNLIGMGAGYDSPFGYCFGYVSPPGLDPKARIFSMNKSSSVSTDPVSASSDSEIKAPTRPHESWLGGSMSFGPFLCGGARKR